MYDSAGARGNCRLIAMPARSAAERPARMAKGLASRLFEAQI
jgi:hypothetical protein